MRPTNLEPNIHIGQVIQNAMVFDFKNWREGPMNTDVLLQSVTKLFVLLNERDIEYLLVGGVALLQYIEGRNTEDIDLIMALSSLKKVPEIAIQSQDINFARGKFEDLQLVILFTRNRLFEKVQKAYATTQEFVEQAIPCATVEGLLLLKLYALSSLYRQGDFGRVGIYENDIATLLYDYQPPLEPLFDELSRHLSDTDIVAVREIVADIEARIDRFRKGFTGKA